MSDKEPLPLPEMLPMEKLVGGPLRAAGEAQKKLAAATAQFLQQVGSVPPSGDEPSPEERTVAFHFDRPALTAVPDANGQVPKESVELDVPLLALTTADLTVPTVEQVLAKIYAERQVDGVTLGSLIGFIPITDADLARGFYAGVLGLTVVQDDGFALVLRSDGNMVRLVRMPQVTPAQFTILGWETANIKADVRALAARGVVFARYSFLQQDELGIWTAPDGDKIAWFTDPDGNVLSLSQH